MVDLKWEARGVVRTLTGVVTAEDLELSGVELHTDVRFDFMRYVIHDFSGVTAIAASQDDVEIVAASESAALYRQPRVNIAFVGGHPVVHSLLDAFLVIDRYEHMCARFDTLDEARQFVKHAGARTDRLDGAQRQARQPGHLAEGVPAAQIEHLPADVG